MPRQTLINEALTQSLQGKQVLQVSTEGKQRLSIQFSDGVTLLIKVRSQELVAAIRHAGGSPPKDRSTQPSKRQLDYLAFIAKYIARFGRAPAESDIQRHFLVSAPSVNQMMQMLERRGFITRQPGVPRSVRICIDLQQNA